MRSFPLRVGVLILPELPWRQARALWRAADDMGFAHAWTYDHLTWRGHRDRPWFAAVPTLTAAAAVTDRIRIGPMVAHPTFRHPLPLAKEAIALDDVSDGRLTLGLGAGTTGWDATMLGGAVRPAAERTARFAEFVAVLDLVLREPACSHAGRYYCVDEARTHPGCVQRPRIPFAVAAGGPRGMALAARYGRAWVTTGDLRRTEPVPVEAGAADVAAQIAGVDRACAEAGREPRSLDRLVVTGPRLDPGLGSVEEFIDAAGRYAEVGVTDLVVHWPRPEQPYRADPAVFERIFG
ncbi:LLM class flavin-dependent oxidoreductase [Pseudonocardia lacus]|uniref:LLM class flavin-dependent oxidoreductase n=1 Tax=Pseudonocardia lacus TaxID=2835865 RepID=UPI001BDDBCF1|nr:LLM class flavin-dependent oxidoreductase [Pseudonocardia lacus]